MFVSFGIGDVHGKAKGEEEGARDDAVHPQNHCGSQQKIQTNMYVLQKKMALWEPHITWLEYPHSDHKIYISCLKNMGFSPCLGVVGSIKSRDNGHADCFKGGSRAGRVVLDGKGTLAMI